MVLDCWIGCRVVVAYHDTWVGLKVLNSDCEVDKAGNGQKRCHKPHSHYSSEHRLIVNFKDPLALKLLVDVSYFVKPVLGFNIN